MKIAYQTTKQAIAGQGQQILDIIAPLSPSQWEMPTKLPPWDVLTLVAHISRATEAIIRYSAQTVAGPATLDAVSYYRFDGRQMAAGINQRAIEAATQTSPATIVPQFKSSLNAALQILEELAPTTIINSIGGPITLADYAITRIIEMTVHTLDLTVALGQPTRYDPAAQSITVATLDALLNSPRPPEYADEIKFIEAATGRMPSVIRLPAFS